MDATVLGLYVGGLAATAAGTVFGAVDVTCRVHAYRDADRAVDDDPDWSAGLDTIQQQMATSSSAIVSAQARRAVEAERAARHHADARLAALFGTSLWPLLIAVGLVLVGALLSGAADVFATLRA